MQRKVRFGLIGPGRVGERLATALSQCHNAEFWSVTSRDQQRAQDFASRFQAKSKTPSYSQFEEMLSDPELDAVIISTPDNLHFESIQCAARFKKNIFVEKPLATSIEDGQEALKLCSESGITIGVGYHLRFKPVLRALAKELHAGAIGDIKHMKVQWAYRYEGNSNWRSSRELARWWALSSLGTHCLDLIRWFMVFGSGEVKEISGSTTREVYKGANDESAKANMRFMNGATAEFSCSILCHQPLSIEITGTKGHVKGLNIISTGADDAQPIYLNGQALEAPDGNAYVRELEDFAEALIQCRAPEVTGLEGLRNIELLFKCQLS